jgi:hypothetical protein
VEEIVGLEDLPDETRKQVLQHFQAFHEDSNNNTPSPDSTPSADNELKLKEGENDIKQSKPRKRRKKDL